ncbi:MAG: ribosomal RNA small subunit methyltransferase A [Desulfobulbaceae bacterium DB1]|nr:MAG: ribosomal RNA small subunit methyltransferase A [Desulfobulbaceae bacterium DB1]
MSIQTIKQILKNEKLAPSKKLGQNFLVHRQTAERIVDLSGVTGEDTVVELGVGLGSLTGPLAQKARHVIGLEIDSGIIEWQQTEGNLADNVTLIHQDLLKADFTELAAQCGGRLKIVANLPYSISNPLLFKLLDNRRSMAWAVLMLQKEVALRLIASPGTKEYGIISVFMAGAAQVRRLLDVGPGQFHPRPKVDSVVVKITFDPPPQRVLSLPPHDEKLLRRIVKSAFQQRRKTLLNALSASPLPGQNKQTIQLALNRAGIDPAIRAEKLTIEQYVTLTHEMGNN